MKKREADAQVKWGKYAREKKWWMYFETKQTATSTITWKTFDDKQTQREINSLIAAMNEGEYIKSSDADPRQKSFDGRHTPPLPAYMIIWWNLHKRFTVIRIGDFLAEKINSTEKSLSYDKACEIAERIVKV